MPTAGDDPQLDDLVRRVIENAKYRAIDQALVRSVGRRELAARRNLKEAVKATRNKLHQVAGAYLGDRPPYDAWLAEIETLAGAGGVVQRCDCRKPTPDCQPFCASYRRMLAHHASTRERLPILDEFFSTCLAELPPIRSVLDLACGLNPVALTWMPLAPNATYAACDIYTDMATFLNRFFRLTGVAGNAFVWDLLNGPPPVRADLALALKIIPPLEQLDKTAGHRLLHSLDADRVLVSYPVRSLGGSSRGMTAFYEQNFRNLVAGESWVIRRFGFANELAFLIDKTG